MDILRMVQVYPSPSPCRHWHLLVEGLEELEELDDFQLKPELYTVTVTSVENPLAKTLYRPLASRAPPSPSPPSSSS